MLDSFSLKTLKMLQHIEPCASWKKHNSKESHIQKLEIRNEISNKALVDFLTGFYFKIR